MTIRTNDTPTVPPVRGGLVDLEDAPLGDAARARLEDAAAGMRGDAAWCARKRAELRDLVALEERAARLELLELDARTDLLVRLRLSAPVPVVDGVDDFPSRVPFDRARRRRPTVDPEHRIVGEAVLTIHYPSAVLTQPLPGIGIVHIDEPAGVWHPNVSHDNEGKLCLGNSVGRGTPIREIVLMCYAALTLQAASLDPVRDPGGVMNSVAVSYWARRKRMVPLTRDPILAPVRQVSQQLADAVDASRSARGSGGEAGS